MKCSGVLFERRTTEHFEAFRYCGECGVELFHRTLAAQTRNAPRIAARSCPAGNHHRVAQSQSRAWSWDSFWYPAKFIVTTLGSRFGTGAAWDQERTGKTDQGAGEWCVMTTDFLSCMGAQVSGRLAKSQELEHNWTSRRRATSGLCMT